MRRRGSMTGCVRFVVVGVAALLSVQAKAQPHINPDYVMVPNGYLTHKSCVHQIPDQAVVREGIVYQDGVAIMEIPPCAYQPIPPNANTHGWAVDGVQNAVSI